MAHSSPTHLPIYSEIGGPCKCGLSSVLRQVTKESANKGRYFYTCPKNQNQDPCDYFVFADGEPSKVNTRYNKGTKRASPTTTTTTTTTAAPPVEKKAKLNRANGVADLGPAIKEAAGFVGNWDSKLIQLNTANAQLLTRAIEQNTLAVEACRGMMEMLVKLVQDNKKGEQAAPDQLQDEDTVDLLIPDSPISASQKLKKAAK